MPINDVAQPSANRSVFPTGTGEMARRIREHDWTATPLGPIAGWPERLRGLVDLMLASQEAMFLVTGPDLVMIYNDPYSLFLPGKHPQALGLPFRTVFDEVWDVLRPMVDATLAGQQQVMADRLFALPWREAAPEGWFTFSWTPLYDEDGAVSGFLAHIRETTDQVRSEARLREGEARLRGVLDGMSESFALLDREFRIVDMNAEARRLERRPPEEVIGKTHWEAHPDADPVLGELFRRAMAERRPLDHEHRYVWPDGRVTWLSVRAYPVTDGLAVFYSDVTAPKLAEERLQESEARFRLMTDAVPQVVWISDRHGRMEFLNRQFVEYTGASSETWTAAEMAERFMHSDDGPVVVAAFEAALATGEPFEIEHRIRSAAGEYRWFLARAEPYSDPETGEIIRWFGASVDIHDRRLAETRLRELNETLEQRVAERTRELDRVWHNSQDLQVVVDGEGALKEVSPAATRILGWLPEEMIGRPLFEFTHPDGHVNSNEKLAGAALGPTKAHLNRYRDKAGNYHWISWITTPADGLIYCYGRDVTAEVERQAELEAAQEQLRQSQKMDAMGQLTGGVAHDFNNLLTPIIGSLDRLLTRGVGSERERRLMDGALQSAERAKTLVQRLLAFARRQPLQPTAVDVRQLVGSMADLIASTVGPRIDVRVEMPEDLPPALADANQVEMAVLNLAVNARDAMPDAGVLSISAARESVRPGHRSKLRPGHYVRLSVKDTGTGMDEATLARAVEPFFSTKGIGKGTGLGLSMVHGLASQLGGGLTIASTPGQGTTVELWLPISTVVAEEEDRQPAKTTATPKGQGTALLVDDEDLVRLSTADMLMDLGYEVVEAQSAEEALRLVSEGLRPDLVVTDHLMPGMTGLDFARDLRSRWPDLPVLIVSGYAEMDGIAPGFPRLTKPFRSAELTASLAALMPSGGK